MKLIALIICLAFEWYLHVGPALRRFGWFTGYASTMHGLAQFTNARLNSIAKLVYVLAPLPALVFLVHIVFKSTLWGLFGLIFSVLVLLMTLEAGRFVRHYLAYIRALDEGDEGSVSTQYQALIDSAMGSEAEQADERSSAQSTAVSEPALQTQSTSTALVSSADLGALLLRANSHIFAVIFWFVILGPAGAVLYRVARLYLEREVSAPVRCELKMLVSLLEWLPVRLCAFGFAIVGQFRPSIGHCFASLSKGWSDNDQVLTRCARAALGRQEGDTGALSIDRDSIDLVSHSIAVWLVFIAILTLTAWVN